MVKSILPNLKYKKMIIDFPWWIKVRQKQVLEEGVMKFFLINR